MGKIYVKATGIIRETDEHGDQVVYHPGSWVPVYKNRARQLFAAGQAEIPRQDRFEEAMQFDGCGILARSDTLPTITFLGRAGELLDVECGAISLPFPGTMLWNTDKVTVTENATIAGFSRLLDFEETGQPGWEILAMLVDENETAKDYGTDEEKARTLNIVGDLRIPVYDTNLMWMRRTANTENIVARWRSEIESGADEQHAFLRSLYAVRAMVCTLPPKWNLRQL